MKTAQLFLRGSVITLTLAAIVLVTHAADNKGKGKGKNESKGNAVAKGKTEGKGNAETGGATPKAVMGRFDKDRNEVLDPKEREALREAFAKDASLRNFDTNRDGVLDNGEINQIEVPPPAPKNKNKKKAAETK